MLFQKIFIIAVLFFNVLAAQEIGQIFHSDELDSLFGKVINSKEIQLSEISKILPLCSNHIMFQLIEGQIIILDEYRNQLYPENKLAIYDDETVFKLFSTSVLIRLLGYSNKNYLVVEKREKSLVVKFEKMAMERGVPCPPDCYKKEYVYISKNIDVDLDISGD